MKPPDPTAIFLGVFQSFFAPFLPHLLWIVPLLVIVALAKTAWFKGWWGEMQVRVWLRLFLDKRDYIALHNATLPTQDGGTTQIDHVLISPYGVFVIETKNYKGWIFGGERQAMWTQKIHKNHSQQFQSPLRQNYAHTQTLAALLELPKSAVHGVVVFVGDSTFKTDMTDNVTFCSGLLRYIRAMREVILSSEQMCAILEKIAVHRLAPSRATHRLHVQNLRARHAHPAYPTHMRDPAELQEPPVPPQPEAMSANMSRMTPSTEPDAAVLAAGRAAVAQPLAAPADAADAAPPACPRCQSAMILRRSKRDPAAPAFWGCSTFPQCRHTQPVAL